MDERDAIVSVDGCSRAEIYHTSTWPVDMVSCRNNWSGGGHCSEYMPSKPFSAGGSKMLNAAFIRCLCCVRIKWKGVAAKKLKRGIYSYRSYSFSRFASYFRAFADPLNERTRALLSDSLKRKENRRRGRRVLAPGSIHSRMNSTSWKNSDFFWMFMLVSQAWLPIFMRNGAIVFHRWKKNKFEVAFFRNIWYSISFFSHAKIFNLFAWNFASSILMWLWIHKEFVRIFLTFQKSFFTRAPESEIGFPWRLMHM